MAKKSISANAEKLGANDVVTGQGAVKFICEYPEKHFMMKEMGPDGKQLTHTDANGNGKLSNWLEFHFVKVSGHKNKEGKVDPSTAFSFFIVDPVKHGAYYDAILEKLSKDAKNPGNRLYTEDEHFQRRNPEAFRIAKEKEEMESTIEAKDLTIEAKDLVIIDLKRKLGLK